MSSPKSSTHILSTSSTGAGPPAVWKVMGLDARRMNLFMWVPVPSGNEVMSAAGVNQPQLDHRVLERAVPRASLPLCGESTSCCAKIGS